MGHRGEITTEITDNCSALVKALGGEALQIRRGLDAINPLDLGPLSTAKATASRGAKGGF